MERLVTAKEMREIDRRATSEWHIAGRVLMENAGRAVVDVIERRIEEFPHRDFLVVCGKGNNGGDGFVATRHLLNRGAMTDCVLLGSASELKGDARENYDVLVNGGFEVQEIVSSEQMEHMFENDPVVVDAIFGTGLTQAPRGLAAKVIDLIGRSACEVVSIDVPSGVDADTGAAFDPCISADFTVTMALHKIGLWVYPGRARAGKVEVADIGIPGRMLLDQGNTFVADRSNILFSLPPRPPDGHKGTFGTALVIAGSRGFSGAACLAGAAAVRSGCGLVRLAIPSGIADIVESRVLEPVKASLAQTDTEAISAAALARAVELSRDAEAVGIGPGLGRHEETGRFLLDFLAAVDKPVVIDADGLNLLAGHLDILGRMKAPAILTPHPGEFSRLAGIPAETANADRVETSRRFAREQNVVLVLKGASTVIAAPDGRVFVNPTGNSGLASGGTGDVLTGLLTGLLAQRMRPADAAVAATFLHGLAADIAVEDVTEYCLNAGDVLDYLPDAFEELRRPPGEETAD